MKYFIGMVLCFSNVCAEAILPENVGCFQLSEYSVVVIPAVDFNKGDGQTGSKTSLQTKTASTPEPVTDVKAQIPAVSAPAKPSTPVPVTDDKTQTHAVSAPAKPSTPVPATDDKTQAPAAPAKPSTPVPVTDVKTQTHAVSAQAKPSTPAPVTDVKAQIPAVSAPAKPSTPVPVTDDKTQTPVVPAKPSTPVPVTDVKAQKPAVSAPAKPSTPVPVTDVKAQTPAAPAKPSTPAPLTDDTPEVKAAKAKAHALYGQESGYLGATDRIITTVDGRRFLCINIKGDGNCGFYASGVCRDRFVETIKNLIEFQHEIYQAFFCQRRDLVNSLEKLNLTDDTSGIVDRIRKLDSDADNGGSVLSRLSLLSNFATEQKKYRDELFQDARQSLINRLNAFEGKVGASLEIEIKTFIAGLAPSNYDDAGLQEFIADNGRKLVRDLEAINVNTTKLVSALKGINEIFTYTEEVLFEKVKLCLINQIQNLTILAIYEAFLEALNKELDAGGFSLSDLTSKKEVLEGVGKVFAKNSGVGSWFPGGLFGAIKGQLKVKYNIWAQSVTGAITLFSSSSSCGEVESGNEVRNMFFTGAHYNLLMPLE